MSTEQPSSVRDLMALWPSLSAFAADTAAGYEAVRQWFKRQSIPVRYWPAVIEGAAQREIGGVTSDLLMKLHAPVPDLRVASGEAA
ncbi:hypothetical protein GCM10007301_15220 [Azorhizobium oxalatiphilum]|uniref:Uncharacterized protein n=1 Tax=Azorhizobium oxalatiphilum TaxID=980631 RepID=A0A917BTV8_9HYPH|nr:hypothetical protein [Azorhizobium oxalatiphilum]GGF56510.1 hypothetical protein GCM10007301_15220 [Azorhizobium oxalatiphilum]